MNHGQARPTETEKALLHLVEGGKPSAFDEHLLRFLLESSSEFIIEHDSEGAVIQGSASAADALAYEEGELVGLKLEQMGDAEYMNHVKRCLETGPQEDVTLLEGTIYRKDGTGFFVRGMARTIGTQKEPRVVVSLRRMERRSSSEQLSQAQKLEAIGQLSAGIAHEINTPTQYVGDNVRFLQDAFAGILKANDSLLVLLATIEAGGQFEAECKVIRDVMAEIDFNYLIAEVPAAIIQTLEGVEQIARIVRAMKEFSHPDRKEKTMVQINTAIESTITVTKNEWKYVAEVATDLDPGLPMISCLPGELNQVFLNLLVNSAQAIAEKEGANSGAKGKISMSTRKDGDWVEIRCQDTGAGIPEYARSRIFEPFYTTKEVGKGTGQGLSLAYTTVTERHGGTIDFETETGQGTTFIIRLPINGNHHES